MDTEAFIEAFLRRRDNGLAPQESFAKKRQKGAAGFEHRFGVAIENLEPTALQAALLRAAETDAIAMSLVFRYEDGERAGALIAAWYNEHFRPLIRAHVVSDAIFLGDDLEQTCTWCFTLYSIRDMPGESAVSFSELVRTLEEDGWEQEDHANVPPKRTFH